MSVTFVLAHASSPETGMWFKTACLCLVSSLKLASVTYRMLPWRNGAYRFRLPVRGAPERISCIYLLNCKNLLLSVEVLPDVWPDHSVLVGRFRALRLAPPTWIWPMPDSLPWPRDFAQNVVWSDSDGDMTAAYAGLWKNIESSACEQSPCPVASRMLGRAAQLAPKKVQAKFAPVKGWS